MESSNSKGVVSRYTMVKFFSAGLFMLCIFLDNTLNMPYNCQNNKQKE